MKYKAIKHKPFLILQLLFNDGGKNKFSQRSVFLCEHAHNSRHQPF